MSTIPGLNTAILDFCTRLNDGPRDEAAARREIPARDPADYEFLRNAMASIEQPEARTKRLLTICAGEIPKPKKNSAPAQQPESPNNAESEQQKPSMADRIWAMEELQEMVEDINIAKEFFLMKGPHLMIRLVKEDATKDDELMTQTALCIAHAAQNNPELQEAFLKENYSDVLFPAIVASTNTVVRSSLVLAVSAIVRANEKTTAAFIESDGFSLLHRLVAADARTVIGRTSNDDSGPNTATQSDPVSAARALRLVRYLADVHRASAAATALATADILLALDAANPNHDEASSLPTDQQLKEAAVGALLAICQSVNKDGIELVNQLKEKLGNWIAPRAAALVEKSLAVDGNKKHEIVEGSEEDLIVQLSRKSS